MSTRASALGRPRSQPPRPVMRYSGSIYNKDFGETETKHFDLIEINYPEIKVSQQPFLASRPMVVLEAEFQDGKFIYDKNFPLNAEIKFKYNVKENERDLISIDQINNLKLELGEDLKIEIRIIPAERTSRSLNIMKAKSLMEEIIEYGKIVGEEITENIKEKVLNIEIDNYEGVEIK